MPHKIFCILCLFGASMLWVTSPLADSKISIQSEGMDAPPQTTAQVKFVIKIPYKLSLKTKGQAIELRSNTGNLLISIPNQGKSIFTSDNSPIQIQQRALSNTDTYTVASP